ncbi:unnamed protein product [Orchesella dallaii]|uniref:C2H2-type domain-containing protein n=1 Tax=Orchesella dallaii TaxID=48710 RepID=A0ABP1PTK4_9HEXA
MPRIPADIFKCTICAKAYKYKQSLIRHQNICHNISGPPVYSCTTCKKTFNHLSCLNRHVKHVHKKIKKYWCVFCQKSFCTKLHLDRHILSHIGEKHFWCNMCNYEVSRKDTLKIHQKQHKKGQTYKEFRCETCSKSFEYKSSYTRHLQTHDPSPPRPCYCTICEKHFTRLHNLERHLRAVHQKCAFCKKQFETVSCLNIHIIKHIGEKPHFCDICDKEFPTRHGLQNHKRLHTKQNLFKCTKCSKVCTKLENLQVHRLNHERKSFQCVICLKMFASNKNLELHILMHVKEKPFFCSECDKEFKEKCALNLHLKRGQCSKKNVISSEPFSSKAKTSQTEQRGGQDGEDAVDEELAQQEIANRAEVSIPNVCLPGNEESRTLPLNRASEAVPEANSVRETTKLPEVKVCEVCGEQFSGEKVDKDYANHIVTNKHYLWKR